MSPSGEALLVELAELDLLTLTQHTEAAGDTISLAQRMVQLTASQQAGHPFVLVRREDRVVAYANYSPHESLCWFVLMLNIHPAWRTPAVLGELLRDSRALFAERGVERLVSHVYRTNAASVRFHRRLGFTVARENARGFEFHVRVADLRLPERLGGLQPAAPNQALG